jgi:hypothetical protein
MENMSLAERHPIPDKVKVNLHMSQHDFSTQLSLRGLRDEVVTQEDAKAGCGFSGVR